ncbi:hypothetical protein G7007_10320 [Pseudomonas entomophila]|jgi:hypothetical protein|uniref:HET-C-related protein n=1 Tax=Pseudomonas entomophila TaxID=312306 RepID=UPI0015E37CDA|nr:HET-C-related protein [Pseudomonas entomophila]MBA1193255.1 hypothetical protein [Pseudomonas entomophila]
MTSSSSTPSFTSRLPLDLLKQMAERVDEQSFVLLLRPLIGRNCLLKDFLAFRRALLQDTLAAPVYTLVPSLSGATAYNAATQSIDVSQAIIDDALQTPEASFSLMTSLLESFAFYVASEVLPRADALAQDDAPSPIGPMSPETPVALTKTLLFYAEPIQPGAAFATYQREADAPPVSIVLGTLEPSRTSRRRTKRFAAGYGEAHVPGSFGHGSITQSLREVGFSDEQCQAIYFGNWLRDHSQLVDPKLVRPVDESTVDPDVLKQVGTAYVRFSRERLATIVDLLALRAFASLQNTPEGRKAYKVTPAMLGVYLHHEHIDNPLELDPNASDPRQIDPDFVPPASPGDVRLGLLPKRSIKRYIRRSIAYVQAKLRAAQREGATLTGMRYLGEALHVLEDYFAHSNFVELCLKHVGHDDVLVWTTAVEKKHPKGHAFPVVTGMFGQLDMIGSLIDPLASHFFPTDLDESQSQEEQEVFDQIVLTILEEENMPWLIQLYGLYVKARRELANNYYYKIYNATVSTLQHHFKPLNYAGNFIMKPLMKWAGDHVATLQVLQHEDPNQEASAPLTHSQLSKDHDTHPFHTLAIQLAMIAVQRVGQAMRDHWSGKVEGADDPVDIAKGFMAHPWSDLWWEETVVQWAKENPEKVKQGTSIETLRVLHARELDALSERIVNMLQKNNEYIQEVEELTGVSWIQVTLAPEAISIPF